MIIFKQCITRIGEITMNTSENVTIHFKIKDYATWRADYDGREKSRLSAGITNGRVLQDVADVPKARSWFSSDDLKAAMQKSGVIGSPNIHFAA
jgi:hypothetical protein